jgi:hypothetical protein
LLGGEGDLGSGLRPSFSAGELGSGLRPSFGAGEMGFETAALKYFLTSQKYSLPKILLDILPKILLNILPKEYSLPKILLNILLF